MEQTFDLPDSTDWLETPLSLVAPLESSLRCQVCKDFFDNPVITSCSHTFCSLCIRRCLSTEGKCPTCRSSDQELKLRRNWAVQELVEAFQNARPSILELARKPSACDGGADMDCGEDSGKQRASKKRRLDPQPDATEGVAEDLGVRTRSQRRGVSQTQTPIEIIDDDIQDEEYVPLDGLVACPICGRRMKNEAVFQHLDKCTGEPALPKPVAFGSLQSSSLASRKPFQDATDKPPERLPMINYSLLKDNVLRKKLKDLGIPNWGPRALMQRRHTEWMNLWNANCDSKTPKPKRDLLRELEIWERTQGGNAAPSADSTNSVMRKDFDAAGWSTTHDNDFKQLIANARKRSDAIVRTTIPTAVPTSSDTQIAPPLDTPLAASISTGDMQDGEGLTVTVTTVDVTETNIQTPLDPSND